MAELKVNKFLFCLPLKYGVVTAAVIAILTAVVELLLGVAVLRNPEAAGLDEQSRLVGVLFFLLATWNLVLFVLLVRALSSAQASYLKPWLIYMLLNVLLALVDIVVCIFTKQFQVFFRLVEVVFFAHLWIAVYSYFKVLNEQAEFDDFNQTPEPGEEIMYSS